jgi:serine/threonine protein kinase/DNA-binding CsgD family transcriptional regulator
VEQLNGLFGERYRFLDEAGRGRFGIVFRAEDLKYERLVAVKALWDREVGESAVQRFIREIGIAARLSHPNILPVLDSGEREGVGFLVMPLAEGGSLRGRLDREGPLPITDALRIAEELLDALRYAHVQGVIHLDVKPENVLLSQGHALLGDFGIARVMGAGSSVRAEERIRPAGSALYMCPAHASGRRSVDPRSDLYSLGCVLYEMLSGEPPFRGPTLAAVVKKHQSEPPCPLTLRGSVSRELDRVVRTALEKEPADRFQDAALFLRALRAVETTLQSSGRVSSSGVRAYASTDRVPGTGGWQGEEGAGKGAHPVTVWIVEDSPDTRSDIQALVEQAEGMTCPVTFESGEAFLEALRTHWAPDVVIMDIGLPGLSGIDTTARLKRSWPGTEVIMFTVHEDFDKIFQAFQAGAISYLDKAASDAEILRAIRVADKRGSVLTPPIARRFLSMFQSLHSAVGAYHLSREELDLLSGLVGGRDMEEIARDLGLNPGEVEARLSLVHGKLHANRDLLVG